MLRLVFAFYLVMLVMVGLRPQLPQPLEARPLILAGGTAVTLVWLLKGSG